MNRPNRPLVTQVSQPAVSPISKSAGQCPILHFTGARLSSAAAGAELRQPHVLRLRTAVLHSNQDLTSEWASWTPNPKHGMAMAFWTRGSGGQKQ